MGEPRYTEEEIPPPVSGEKPANDTAPTPRRPLLPAFPIHALPPAVAAYCTALADFVEVSPEMPAVFALGALSATLIGKIKVSPKQGWREPPILYVSVVAEPSERKSPVMRPMMAPLYKIDREEREAWKAECERIDEENEGKEKGEKPEKKPPMPSFVMGDVTPEKLASVMSLATNTRLALLSEEASVLEMASGLYSAKTNLDIYLKSYDCGPLIVHRKVDGALYVDAPSLTVVQCAQRSVFVGLAKHPELRGKGLLPRFLFSVPPSMTGFRVHDRPPVDPMLQDAWNGLVTELYHWTPGDNERPRIVSFDRLAQEELLSFQHELEKLIRPGARFDSVKDMSGKLGGAMIRIALILWCAEASNEERNDTRAEISGSTVRKAIEIAKYFLRHGEHVLVNLLQASPGDGAAKVLWDWLQKKGATELVLGREFQQKGPRSLRNSKERATEAANLLVDRGLLERSGPGWIVVGSGDSE